MTAITGVERLTIADRLAGYTVSEIAKRRRMTALEVYEIFDEYGQWAFEPTVVQVPPPPPPAKRDTRSKEKIEEVGGLRWCGQCERRKAAGAPCKWKFCGLKGFIAHVSPHVAAPSQGPKK